MFCYIFLRARSRAIFILMSWLWSVSAIAGSPVIVVTPSGVEVPEHQSPVPVVVINRSQIERSQATDVADILNQYAGLEVARNGGSGSVTSIFTRGADSNHTLVLVDGVKINPATIGAPALQNISPAMIERIEIVKGPRSSVYGSDAIGGVVNIITRQGMGRRSASVSVSTGSLDSQRVSLNGNASSDHWTGGLSLDGFETEGFNVVDVSDNDHGYDNASWNAFLTYQKHDDTLSFRHWQSDGSVEYYAFGEQQQDYRNAASVLQWQHAVSAALDSRLRFSRIADEIDQKVANFLSQFDTAKTIRDEIEWRLDYQQQPGWQWSFGVQLAREQVDALSFGTEIDETTDIDEWYALSRFDLDHHIVSISVRSTDHQSFQRHHTWNIDYRFPLQSDASFYASMGSAFRAPDHTDRFGSIGNPDLNPETSDSIELGLILDFTPHQRFQLTLFKTRIQQLIEPNAGFTQMENIDSAQIEGVELSLTGNPQPWSYRFDAVLQTPRNHTSGEMLSRRAGSRIKAMIGYQRAAWSGQVLTQLVDARDDSSFNDIVLPAYQLIDVSVAYRLSSRSGLRFQLNNLTNEDYEMASGFNTQGRHFMLEYHYQWLRE